MFKISLVKSTQHTKNEDEVEECRQAFFVDFVYFVIVFFVRCVDFTKYEPTSPHPQPNLKLALYSA